MFREIPFLNDLFPMATDQTIASATKGSLRLLEVQGFEDRKNDIIYGYPFNEGSNNGDVIVFFPGDVQDYIENMEAHRDNKYHKEWNLVDTAEKLRQKFPENHILVVKPSRMDYKTFSCFQNFVKSSELGVPNHTSNYNSLRHLDNLLRHTIGRLQVISEDKVQEASKTVPSLNNLNLIIIGFSKGCVVLNQFLHEFHHFLTTEPDEIVSNLIQRIKEMYWLDGGHSGGKNTWVNDRNTLKTFCSLGIQVHVHVTPYQIHDDRRPWIKKEEKIFSDYISKNGGHITRTVHFETVSPSILTHFEVINAFKN
ncbi:hypothetical protein ABEB36_004187 [Hypothenemus hampei]|uniref:Uncharacterized protein n=1 Tax=Hypothenemus hampei TaxID=57062 RepID=A0ABD1F2H4_HYPHA